MDSRFSAKLDSCPGRCFAILACDFFASQVHVRVESVRHAFYLRGFERGQILKMPIAHIGGSYFCDETTLAELERTIKLFSVTRRRMAAMMPPEIRTARLPILPGICNRERNVMGLMPHPERAVEAPLGSADGLVIFRSMVESLVQRIAVPA